MKSVRSSVIIGLINGERAISAIVGIKASSGSPRMYLLQISCKTTHREDINICRFFSIRPVCMAFKFLSTVGPFDDHTV